MSKTFYSIYGPGYVVTPPTFTLFCITCCAAAATCFFPTAFLSFLPLLAFYHPRAPFVFTFTWYVVVFAVGLFHHATPLRVLNVTRLLVLLPACTSCYFTPPPVLVPGSFCRIFLRYLYICCPVLFCGLPFILHALFPVTRCSQWLTFQLFMSFCTFCIPRLRVTFLHAHTRTHFALTP